MAKKREVGMRYYVVIISLKGCVVYRFFYFLNGIRVGLSGLWGLEVVWFFEFFIF